MKAIVARFRAFYGASPLHLIAHLVLFGVAIFTLRQIFIGGPVKELLDWFIGFAILQDLVFIPGYSLLDRLARALIARLPQRARTTPGLPLVNYVRVPAFISGVLLLLYLPLISGKAESQYVSSVGHPLEGYRRNWLLITAALFIGSGLTYALRTWRQRRRPAAV